MAELRAELRGDDEVWLSGPCDPALYGRLCDPLVRAGRLAHFVEVAAGDDAELDRWYGLSFGRQQVHASRSIEPVAYEGPVRVRAGDIETALLFSAVMFDHLAGPAVWSSREPRPAAEVRHDWEEFLAEPTTANFVAELDGKAVAHLVLGDEGEPGAIELAVAATLPEARGRGAMRALVAAAFGWAAERGYTRCDTDWRSTNLEAASCWAAFGFRPTRFRLPRLAGR
jgi:GNAT superfamily N-acetyltransferase